MIELNGAVKIAIDFVNSIYGVRGYINPRLEEIELSDDKRYWYATIGFWSDPGGQISTYIKRVIKIDANDGTVLSAKDKYGF